VSRSFGPNVIFPEEKAPKLCFSMHPWVHRITEITSPGCWHARFLIPAGYTRQKYIYFLEK